MSEMAKGFYLNIISCLSHTDFQVLCCLYLRDRGYDARLGRMPGSDFAHDLYGYHSDRRFIGHCTKQKESLRQKLRADILSGVREAQKHRTNYPEILFFSLKRVFASPAKEASFIKEQLIPTLLAEDAEYIAHPPTIILLAGDQLAQDIATSPRSSQAKIFLLRKLSSEVDIDAIITDDDQAESAVADTVADFRSTIEQYSLLMPAEIRLSLLLSIVATASSRLLFDPRLAQDVLSISGIESSSLYPFLGPLCKTALSWPLTEVDLLGFFDVLTRSDFREAEDLTVDHLTATLRLLRMLVYQRDTTLSQHRIVTAIQEVTAKNQRFWQPFLFDLYLRYTCGYISLDNHFVAFLKEGSGLYVSHNPEKPLSKLWPVISDPLQFVADLNAEEVVDRLKDIARLCTSSLEARWCISAALRVLPLYPQDEDETGLAQTVLEVIRAIPEEVTARSPQVAFKHLAFLLHAFLRRKNSAFLAEYQSYFMRYRSALLRPQVLELQLEYAACLYAFCQFYSFEELMQLEIGFVIGSKQDLFSHPLFANSAWANGLQAGLLSNKKGVYVALSKYIRRGFHVHVRPLLRSHHLRLLDFPALRRIYQLRPPIAEAIRASLTSFLAKEVQVTPAFFARSTAVFRAINRPENEELVSEYIREASFASTYDKIRNARHITYSLYAIYYYSGSERRAEAEKLCAQLSTEFSIAGQRLGHHWIYIAGMKFPNSALEMRFAAEFGIACLKLERHLLKLSSKGVTDTSVAFSDEMLAILEQYRERGSVFANTILQDIQEPEFWNVLATTVYNNRPQGRSKALAMASYFYAIAKSFARQRKLDDQKFCYNYIRCRSLDLLEYGGSPASFLVDTSYYLALPTSEFFAYRMECLSPFMKLLGRSWPRLQDDDRTRIKKSLLRVEWLRPEFFRAVPPGEGIGDRG